MPTVFRNYKQRRAAPANVIKFGDEDSMSSGLDHRHSISQLADIANEWRRLDTHTGEWGIGRAERSAIDFFYKVYFPVYKGNPRKHMPCAFCYEFAILAVEFCDRGKGSVLPNFF